MTWLVNAAADANRTLLARGSTLMPAWCNPLRPFHAIWFAVKHEASVTDDVLCLGCSIPPRAKAMLSGDGSPTHMFDCNTSTSTPCCARTSRESSCADSSLSTSFDSSNGSTPTGVSASTGHTNMVSLPKITSMATPDSSSMHVEHWLKAYPMQFPRTQQAKRRSSTLLRHGKTLLIATGAVTIGHKALPASAVWVRGTRWAGTATRLTLFYLGGKLLLRKNKYRDLPSTPICINNNDAATDGGSPQKVSAMTVLDMTHLPWMNEDNAYRILVNEGNDLDKARAKAMAMHLLRRSIGLDLIQYPHPVEDNHRRKHQAQQGSSRKKSSLHSYFTSKSDQYRENNKPATASPGSQACVGRAAAVLQQACPAWQAIQQFPEVARALGGSLVHVDDKVGRAVLWVEGRKLANVKADMCSVLGIDPSTTIQQYGSAPGTPQQQQPAWQAAAAVHVAVMSDWLWRAKLPGFPLEAGRHVQVVDLKGLRVAAALGDGLAVLRAIMAAATQFPQRLEATLIINPPTGLTLAWNIIAQLLPHAVAAKIKFVRGSGQKLVSELLRYMPQDMIPAEYGGGWTGPMADHPAQQEIETALKHSLLERR